MRVFDVSSLNSRWNVISQSVLIRKVLTLFGFTQTLLDAFSTWGHKLPLKSHTIIALKILTTFLKIILQVAAAEHNVFELFGCICAAWQAICNQPCFRLKNPNKWRSTVSYISSTVQRFTVHVTYTECMVTFSVILFIFLFHSVCGIGFYSWFYLGCISFVRKTVEFEL